MKPLEARLWLQQATSMLMAGQPLPPEMRAWLGYAMRRRHDDPGTSLDALLGLRSRRGGRLSGHSKLPERDHALAALGQGDGPTLDRARALQQRIEAHRRQPDEALVLIEKQYGRLPRSLSQLQRILSGRTCASQMKTP